MHKIERIHFGYKLTFADFIRADEMLDWLREAEQLLSPQIGAFSVLVDMRDLKPLPSDAQQHLQKGQKLFKTKGMERSAVVLQNPVITLQFKRLATETGIYAWERYFDASKTPDWEAKATAWLTAGIDPDK